LHNTDTGRHYCRNPKCRSKLPVPVSNPREAFCTRGCHNSFYRKRCLVCEAAMERRTERQLVCGKRKCRNALKAGEGFGRYHTPSYAITPLENSIKSGIKSGVADGRPRRIVAGPPLTPSQLHCATVPDGPGCRWEGGEYQRLEARNRALPRKHVSEQAAKCLIQPHHSPVNVLGGYRFPDAPVVDLGVPTAPEARKPTPPMLIGDPLEIPNFLRRNPPQAETKLAA
jgi:hypothetical protein